ncbi:MAG: LysM peptidoglycan-binding domain-containing protein [Clostridium sp.]|nr:LysM peptidoglycan-binding domain-containing protein [Clostridium sp.]
MGEMATTDIVIHKGEKEEKYQLYVEDYVISYLKNYKDKDDAFFFYGKREKDRKRYYIYGAGNQRQITYFKQYVLLEEIRCHFTMDMPVFSIEEDTGIYELAGYDIFYQSNEAMQNYMVEHRKEVQYRAGAETKTQERRVQRNTDVQKAIDARKQAEAQQKRNFAAKNDEKKGNGLMAVQLSAIFVILIAIVINSTNSYTKLEELNQAAVEVFFAIENQEADIPTEGTVLRLSDLDAKFEEENQAVKKEEIETEMEAEEETETGKEEAEKDKEAIEEASMKEGNATEEAAPSQQAYGRNFAEYYQIEKGDTLYTISIKLYGDTSKVNEICELNQIKDPDNIKYGQKILLP